MSRRTTGSEEDDEEDGGPFGDDDAGVFWCPHCGSEMYGDSSRCPTCGDYGTPGARPSARTPWWIWLGIIVVGAGLLAGLAAKFN